MFLIMHNMVNKADFYQAEIFARMNYETFMEGSDPESMASAMAILQLEFLFDDIGDMTCSGICWSMCVL